MATIKVAFRGSTHDVTVSETTTLGELSSSLQGAVGISLASETMKLLRPKGAAIALAGNPGALLADAGITPGMRLMLVASSEADVAQLRAAREQPGMLSFEGEEKRAAQRRRRAGGAVQLPAGPYTFGTYQVLEHTPSGRTPNPPPKKALALLHRLAADPGISSIMRNHGWSVGLLSEMPPEGKVGISAMCVLGYNVNKGQEVSLRLRTDDWRGFRKYARIRETLIHELAHMVWSEHDNNFKTLNSQLLQECARADVASGSAHTLAGNALAALGVDGSSDDEGEDEISNEAMRATAALSGRTLRDLAAGSDVAAGAGVLRLSPREAAAEAAVLRQLERQQQQQQQHQQHQPPEQAPAAVQQAAERTPEAQATMPAAASSRGGRDGSSGMPTTSSASSSDAEEGADAHYDPDTEEAEMQLRRLGTLEGSEELPQAVEELLDRKLSGQLLDEQLLDQQLAGVVQEATGVPQQHMPNQQQSPDQQQQAARSPSQTQTPAATAAQRPGLNVSPAGLSDAAAGSGRQVTSASATDAASSPSAAAAAAAAASTDAITVAAEPTPAAAQRPIAEEQPSSATDMDVDAPEPAAGTHRTGSSDAATAAQHAGIAGDDSAAITNDPAAERLRQAQSALQELVASTSARVPGGHLALESDELTVALDTLAGVLGNVSKGEQKYRQVKVSGLKRRLGRGYDAGLKLLQLAGFAVEGGSAVGAGVGVSSLPAEEGQQLVYARNDPGLLWLVSSVVEEQLQQQRIEGS